MLCVPCKVFYSLWGNVVLCNKPVAKNIVKCLIQVLCSTSLYSKIICYEHDPILFERNYSLQTSTWVAFPNILNDLDLSQNLLVWPGRTSIKISSSANYFCCHVNQKVQAIDITLKMRPLKIQDF